MRRRSEPGPPGSIPSDRQTPAPRNHHSRHSPRRCCRRTPSAPSIAPGGSSPGDRPSRPWHPAQMPQGRPAPSRSPNPRSTSTAWPIPDHRHPAVIGTSGVGFHWPRLGVWPHPRETPPGGAGKPPSRGPPAAQVPTPSPPPAGHRIARILGSSSDTPEATGGPDCFRGLGLGPGLGLLHPAPTRRGDSWDRTAPGPLSDSRPGGVCDTLGSCWPT